MGRGKGDPGLAWPCGAAGSGCRLAPAAALAPGCSSVLWQASHCEREAPAAQPDRENSPMATGTEKGVQVGQGAQGNCVGAHSPVSGGGHGQGCELTAVQHAPSLIQAAHGPAACYRELSRFPAVTRATLRAAAGGQTFLLYTGEWRAGPPPPLWPAGAV